MIPPAGLMPLSVYFMLHFFHSLVSWAAPEDYLLNSFCHAFLVFMLVQKYSEEKGGGEGQFFFFSCCSNWFVLLQKNTLIFQAEIIQDWFPFIFKGKNRGIKTLFYFLCSKLSLTQTGASLRPRDLERVGKCILLRACFGWRFCSFPCCFQCWEVLSGQLWRWGFPVAGRIAQPKGQK